MGGSAGRRAADARRRKSNRAPGDSLWFEAPGVDVTDSGSVLAAAGFGNVTYSSFESAQVWAPRKKSWTTTTATIPA